MKPQPGKHALLFDVLGDVYLKRIEKHNELESIYEREWVRGCMTYEHISELSQEVEKAFEHADETIAHILRKDKEREAQEIVTAFVTAMTRNVEPPLAYSSQPPRSLVEQHSPPNLSRHLSSNAPPAMSPADYSLSTHAYSRGYSPAYHKGNAHHT
jgi:hypothetical protein